MGRILILGLLCLSIVHCSKSRSPSYTNVPAPQKETDLGFITRASETEIASLQNSFPQITVRTLNAKQGLFELSHVSEGDLKSVLGSSRRLQKNAFVKAFGAKLNEKITLKNLAKNTSKDAEDAIDTCMESESVPEILVDISYSPETLTVEFGTEVTISATANAHADVGGDVRILWDIIPPSLSKNTFTKGIASEQTFTPDEPGFYRIAIVAQGTDLTCVLMNVPLFVTYNPQLNVNATLAKLPPATLFKHLTSIKANEAWTSTKGKGVAVAVLDTGLNYNHPSINKNLRIKTEEVAADTENPDTDNNGFNGDFLGWDFINGDNLPYDDDGHGTHVSGLVASPVSGVAPESQIIPVKVLNAAGGSDVATIVAGIYYAADSGAQVINASLGFDFLEEPPLDMKEAIDYARTKNVVFMVAAGNGDKSQIGFDIKTVPVYPASFQLDNLITVASTALGSITTYSNFNAELVHIAAPGGNEKEPVWSLATSNAENFAFMPSVGTSMASPVAAGVAALILSANPVLTPLEVRNILIESGDALASLKGKIVSEKQINARAAVQKALDLGLASPLN